MCRDLVKWHVDDARVGRGFVVTVMVFDVAAVNAVAVKRSVRAPSAPVIERLLNAATPLALVVAVRVPPKVPAPVAIAAVTTTPA